MTLSKSLIKLIFKRIPKKSNNKSMIVVKVENASLQRDKWTYVATTPKIYIKIGSVFVDAMLDSSVEVNVITRSLVDKARLTIQTNLILVLKIVLGDTRRFDRAYKDVEVSISSIESIQTIIVIKNIDYKLILGCPF